MLGSTIPGFRAAGDALAKGIGDVNSDAKGSGARYNTGKVQAHLTPLHLLDEVNRVWEYGQLKYATWNWAKGMPWSVPYACILRHAAAWFRGERNDPESGYSHLAHIACNVLMLLHYETAYPEGDDRPTVFAKEEPLGFGVGSNAQCVEAVVAASDAPSVAEALESAHGNDDVALPPEVTAPSRFIVGDVVEEILSGDVGVVVAVKADTHVPQYFVRFPMGDGSRVKWLFDSRLEAA